MKKTHLQFSLPVVFLRGKQRFIAYTPALDLSTAGTTFPEAKKRFAEAAGLFFEEIVKKGTLNQVLEDLGWQRLKNEWQPPIVVSQQPETIRIPVKA